jgi:hypothetical protein
MPKVNPIVARKARWTDGLCSAVTQRLGVDSSARQAVAICDSGFDAMHEPLVAIPACDFLSLPRSAWVDWFGCRSIRRLSERRRIVGEGRDVAEGL